MKSLFEDQVNAILAGGSAEEEAKTLAERAIAEVVGESANAASDQQEDDDDYPSR